MKSNCMVYAILVFGVIVSICAPHLVGMALRSDDSTYETNNEEFATTTQYTPEVAAAIPVADEQVTVVEEKQPEAKEEVVVEPLEEEKNIPTQEQLLDPIVYDGMTLAQLTVKLNKVLHSTLTNTGTYFAKYCLDYGVDPYIAVAITLHETGCNSICSNMVKQYNNVGGMRSHGGYLRFSTLEEGIKAYIYNLKKNYYDKGLTTLPQMNKKYAASTAWSKKVNHYVNKIKAA